MAYLATLRREGLFLGETKEIQLTPVKKIWDQSVHHFHEWPRWEWWKCRLPEGIEGDFDLDTKGLIEVKVKVEDPADSLYLSIIARDPTLPDEMKEAVFDPDEPGGYRFVEGE